MSSTAKHTRAPWRSQGWVPTWAYIPVHDADHNLVASLYPSERQGYSRDQVEANAHLIAAAPAMVDALTQAEIAVTELCQDQNPANECWNVLRQVRAAIASAKGAA